MKPHLILVFFAVGVATVSSSVVEGPANPNQSRVGFTPIVTALEKCDMVVFDYGNGAKAFVTDRKWIEAFAAVLASSSGKRDAHCLCIAYPLMKFIAKEVTVAEIEITHGNKVRVWSKSLTGEFILPDADYSALLKLSGAVKPTAVKKLKPPIIEIPKIVLDLPMPSSSSSRSRN